MLSGFSFYEKLYVAVFCLIKCLFSDIFSIAIDLKIIFGTIILEKI